MESALFCSHRKAVTKKKILLLEHKKRIILFMFQKQTKVLLDLKNLKLIETILDEIK